MVAPYPLFKIVPTTQTYDWGKTGTSSKVAQLGLASQIPGFDFHEQLNYAELWMGTHSKSPSTLRTESREPLASHLHSHPEQLLGPQIISAYPESQTKGNLPFLFKVLSIAKPLSIQAHPDKKMAEELHNSQPDIYKDDNHKPEMALAMTPFEALCGFRPLAEIVKFLETIPEFASLIPGDVKERFLSAVSHSRDPDSSEESKSVLRELFSAMMTSPAEVFQPKLRDLVERYAGEKGNKERGGSDDELNLADLVLRIESEFPGDIGIFCVFVLNYVVLQPGEAMFLGAGEPHAYITGDIMECMANSDNVIRAGLTPKLRDVPNLIAGLTYKSGPPHKHFCLPKPFGAPSTEKSMLYDPPIPEFSVVRTVLQGSIGERHRSVLGPSIAVVTHGTGVVRCLDKDTGSQLNLTLGDVFFVGAGSEIELLADNGGMEVYRAFVEVSEDALRNA